MMLQGGTSEEFSGNSAVSNFVGWGLPHRKWVGLEHGGAGPTRFYKVHIEGVRLGDQEGGEKGIVECWA